MALDLNVLALNRLKEAAALLLWESGAVKINLEKPFKLASGNFSPIYVNCRQVISNPAMMSLFITATKMILDNNGVEVDAFAGGETAGIPFSAYAAHGLGKSAFYVRKAKKGYGIANLVEGGNAEGKRFVLIEDLITDAGSKLHFIEAIGAAGGTVKSVLVLFDRLQGGEQLLKSHGIDLYSVSDMNAALEVAERENIFPESSLKSVKQYLANPRGWHKDNKLEFIE
ncbi:MAG: orotate phosphoribosyltransferase [Calditrichaeota bacterium]|jgi:orotate phosphoribosyltransferase|nr:orotate phosphoribosyltransferase [Calditrichota bacterium]MBT7788922.1 orotate phosphoribosyltransferase [Calditrichota bacterium]